MFKVLQILGFWAHRKMSLEFFEGLIWGRTRALNKTLGFEMKFPSKFFGYVESSAVSWIFSASNNLNRLFYRTDPGQTRTLNRTLRFKIISLRNFFSMLEVLQFLGIKVHQKILLDFFVDLLVNRTLGLEKKNTFDIFLACLRLCGFWDFQFIKKCQQTFI